LGFLGGFLCLGKNWEEDGGKDCNNCDYDKKFNERKAIAMLFSSSVMFHFASF
jgi:hypothetical protein